MSKWSTERWAASTGIGFAVVLLVSALISGSQKDWNASPAAIQSYLHGKHKEILISGVLYGLGYLFILWFLASFAGTFREAGQGRLATIMYGAGVAAIAVGAINDGLGVALAKVTYPGSAATVATLYGIHVWLSSRVFWMVAVLALATFLAARRSRVMPDWYSWLTLLAAALFALAGVAMRNTGFFSGDGGMTAIAFLALVVWVALSSMLVMQRVGAEASAPAVASPA